MIAVITPEIAVADAILFIKNTVSKKLKAKFPFIQKPIKRKSASGQEDNVYFFI